MKMTRRSPDERLCPFSRFSRFSQLSPEERFRIAADCLSRRGLRPDPMSIPREMHNIEDNPDPLI